MFKRNRSRLFSSSAQKFFVIGAAFLLLCPIVYVAYILETTASDFFSNLVLSNYPFFFGLPYAAILSYFVVGTVESTRGAVEFEFFGLKFKGAAGPLVFWLLIFLSIVLSIKILWVPISGE